MERCAYVLPVILDKTNGKTDLLQANLSFLRIKNLPSPTLGRKYENPLGGDFLNRRLQHQMISLLLLLLHLLNRTGLLPIERLLREVR